MATLIVDDCINCGLCEPACPNKAITAGEQMYVIEPLRCTECVGFHGEEQCAKVCPVEACLPDPDREEAETVLISRARKLHPRHVFAADFPSRFRTG
ncbi:MAG TPA: YfhL family 4Fe-4S dicluster ferredoxin [Myxococcota bacterium]|jgi:ferredoxin